MKGEKTRSMKRTLQLRFVLLATSAAALLLGVIVGTVLLRGYAQMTKKADHLLEVIRTSPDSPEIGDTHYFTVTLSPRKNGATAELSHTAYMQEAAALAMGRRVLKSEKDRGFLDGYRFLVIRETGGARILFLSRKLPLETFRDTRKLLIWVSLLGLGVTGILLSLVSGRVVAPLVAANEKQKIFITSASHALKTPVAVILGDTQLLQMDMPDNEWLADIEKQTKRLTEMTQSLVTLSRCDEGTRQGSFLEFPLSDLAEDTAASFQAPAVERKLNFRTDIQPNLSYYGDEKALREMISILLDNAVRYCPAGGDVTVTLEKIRRKPRITVQNTARNLRKEELPHFTERFYRGSTSENTAGSGLGLAIAQSIALRHGGTLSVTAPTDQQIAVQIRL